MKKTVGVEDLSSKCYTVLRADAVRTGVCLGCNKLVVPCRARQSVDFQRTGLCDVCREVPDVG